MASLQWIKHRGKQILLLDLTYLPALRAEELAREVQQVVTAQPLSSVLLLADFTGTTFSGAAVRQIAKAAAADRPHILRSAWVGTDTLGESWFKAIEEFSHRQIRRFSTREEALQFLTSNEPV